MFLLRLFDRNGTELNLGDIVKISDGKKFKFYCVIKWIESEKALQPFHTFCFHSFEKVDKIPEGAIKTKSDQDYWFIYSDEAEEDKGAESFDEYLRSWRDCEILLEKRCYQIELQKQSQLKLF